MMNEKRLPCLTALILVAIGNGACTPVEDPAAGESASAPECFRVEQITGFSDAGDDRIHVFVGANDTYLLETVVCPQLDFSLRLGLRARGGSSYLCEGFDADLLVPTPGASHICPVRMIRKVPRADARHAGEP